MLFTRLNQGPLMDSVDGNPAGGTPPPTEPVTPPSSGPDLTKLFERMENTVSKSISDMRKEMQDRLNATDTRMRLVIDDLLEGATSSTKHNDPTPTPVLAPVAPVTPSPSAASSTEDAVNLATVLTRRKLRESEEAKAILENQIKDLVRDNRQTKIESSVNSAMAKLTWAEGASEMVSSQMIAKADIDADGKVKISGADPAKYIGDWQATNRWTMPVRENAGSGNTPGTSRRTDGSIDLSTYNPAKIDPNSDEFRKLIEQTKRQGGG